MCEVCGRSEARQDDILCRECTHYYAILSDLLEEHPDLSSNELDRLKQVLRWREAKIQLKHRVIEA